MKKNGFVKIWFLITIMGIIFSGTVSAAGQAEEEVPVLEIWHYQVEGVHVIDEAVVRWNEQFGDEFLLEERYIPFGELKREISQAVLVGNVPDIVNIDNPDHASFASEGILADITDRVNAWGEINEFFDGPRNSVIYDQRYYGVPDNSNTLALYYNKDMFAEAGIDAPPANWEEMREYSARLTDPDAGVYGITFCAMGTEEGTFQLLPFLQMAGADVDSLDSPGAVEALAYLTDLVKNGMASREVVNQAQEDAAAQFAAGNAAMAIGGPWSLETVRTQSDFEWSLALLPVKEAGGLRASALGGENWAIMADSPHVEEAWTFIQWYSEADTVRELFWDYYGGGRIPSRADVANEPDKWAANPELSLYIEQLQYAVPRGPHPQWPQLSQEIQRAIQRSLTGQASPKEALMDAAQEVNQYF